MADRLTDKILGRYRIIREIDKGGMGKVYLAEHTLTGKRVALKTLLMGWLLDLSDSERREIEERFRREAQAAAQISHENVVEVYDFDVATEKTPAYIAMEFLAGESLEKTLEKKGRFALEQALPLMIQISDGIAEAHKKGFIHRDLKPANIMVVAPTDSSKKERIKIVDFGITKVFNSDLTRITKHGQILGTPTHTAPEQWGTSDGSEINERADVYALGLIFYEMLSGEMPYQSNSPQGWLACHLYDKPKPMSDDIPQEIAEIIFQSLEKDREKRPASAVELLTKLVGIENQIREDEKKKEREFIKGIQAQLRDSKEIIENYNEQLKLKNLEIEKLTQATLALTEEKNQLSELLKKRSDVSDEKTPKRAINAKDYTKTKNRGMVTAEVHATSHIGRVYKGNEDNYLLLHISDKVKVWTSSQEPDEFVIESQKFQMSEMGVVLAVSDGMGDTLVDEQGGIRAGEIASKMAVETVGQKFIDQDNTIGLENFNDSLISKLYDATLYANYLIRHQGRNDLRFRGMNATFTGVGITPETVDLVQIGDSRAYLFRNENIYQVTKDQSYVQELIDTWQIQPEEAGNHAHIDFLLQSLGAQVEIHPVVARLQPQRGDVLLLCSDGLSNKVSGTDMQRIIFKNIDQLHIAAAELVKMANERGGEDNITLILVKLMGDLPEPHDGEVKLEVLKLGDVQDTADQADTVKIL